MCGRLLDHYRCLICARHRCKPDPAPACVGLLLHADEHPRPDLHPVFRHLVLPHDSRDGALQALRQSGGPHFPARKAERRKARHGALSHVPAPVRGAPCIVRHCKRLSLFSARRRRLHNEATSGRKRLPQAEVRLSRGRRLKAPAALPAFPARADGGAPFPPGRFRACRRP